VADQNPLSCLFRRCIGVLLTVSLLLASRQLKLEITNLSRLVEQGAGLNVGQENTVNIQGRPHFRFWMQAWSVSPVQLEQASGSEYAICYLQPLALQESEAQANVSATVVSYKGFVQYARCWQQQGSAILFKAIAR
jgi:hypothetical protein